MLITLSLIAGYIATIASVAGFQLKTQKNIIISQSIANALVAISYFLLGPSKMAGGAACAVGTIQTLVNYFYFRRNKTPHKFITVIFFFCYVASSALTIHLAGTLNFPNDLLPLLGSLVFLFAVSTPNPTVTRILSFVNMLIWLTFDCLVTPIAVANLVTHICITISVIVGLFRYDILIKGEIVNEQ